MTEGIKILVTVDEKLATWIDETLKKINKNKQSYQTKAHRQALIRACINYAMREKPEFTSMWSRDVYITRPK